jgi:DinB family protein
MKTRIAWLTVVALGVSAVCAAQAPTPSERADAVAHLEKTRQAFLKSIEGLSEAQWTFKAAPDRWSIAEVAEHITVSESFILPLVTAKIAKGPAMPAGATTMPTTELMAALEDRTKKFQAPEPLQPTTKRWPSRDAMIKDFNAARDKTIAYVKTTADDLHGRGAEHPVFKMLDGYQWIMLISGHAARHTAQIEEVKTAAGYPR